MYNFFDVNTKIIDPDEIDKNEKSYLPHGIFSSQIP